MKTINARVLILRDTSCDKWAAQCLEYDIAAQGDTLEDAMNRFERTFVGSIVLSLKNEQEPLSAFAPAPASYFELWEKALALQDTMPIDIPRDSLPENVLKFPDRVPRGDFHLKIAA